MAKRKEKRPKFLKCGCSTSSLFKPDKESVKRFKKGPSYRFTKCECADEKKRFTKMGDDKIILDVEVSPKKGYELTL